LERHQGRLGLAGEKNPLGQPDVERGFHMPVRSGAIEAGGGAPETKGMVASRGGGHGGASETKGTRVRSGKEHGWPAGTTQELEPGPWWSAVDAVGGGT
jgi:hypothetical protein